MPWACLSPAMCSLYCRLNSSPFFVGFPSSWTPSDRTPFATAVASDHGACKNVRDYVLLVCLHNMKSSLNQSPWLLILWLPPLVIRKRLSGFIFAACRAQGLGVFDPLRIALILTSVFTVAASCSPESRCGIVVPSRCWIPTSPKFSLPPSASLSYESRDVRCTGWHCKPHRQQGFRLGNGFDHRTKVGIRSDRRRLSAFGRPGEECKPDPAINLASCQTIFCSRPSIFTKACPRNRFVLQRCALSRLASVGVMHIYG